MTAGEQRKPTIAIIGAGLTGLLTAHGLQKNGFSVTLFEREPSLDARPRDWTILIHWAMPTLTRLLPPEILANLPQAICNRHLEFTEEVETLPAYNAATGELLFRSKTPGARRITRQRLRRVLAEGVRIEWGRRVERLGLTAAGDGVRLEFADGRTFDADYVVGADGASSTVRGLLLGAEAARPVMSGFMFASGVPCYGDAEKTEFILKAHPVTALMMGTETVGGCGVMYADDPNDKSTWDMFWVKIWKGTPVNLQGPEAVRYIKENTKGVCDTLQNAIDWTPEDSPCNIDEMKYWVSVPWDNHSGRVTLLGDAAHPMLPFRGQGLQHALEDASNYVNAMVKLGYSPDDGLRQEVMTAFDAEMVARGAKAVRESLQEAENSLDVKTIGKMIMATRGHGKSTTA